METMHKRHAMPDQTVQVLTLVWEWGRNLLIFILGIFGWHIRTQAKRLSDIEKDMAIRSEVTNHINTLRSEIQTGFRHLENRIDRMKDKS